ncbi:hypothetical protein PMAYCL1PPCAC_21430, partial [Pristionchus mayeri]
IKCIWGYMGENVRKVELIGDDIDSLCKLLYNIEIEHLHLTFVDLSDEQVTTLLEFVERRKVSHLTLSVSTVTASDPVCVLYDLASRVSALHIHQTQCELDGKSPYLFGLHNANWESIVLEMFSRKLDKLRITNLAFPNYLPAARAEGLTENLPKLERRVWFEAIGCSADLKAPDISQDDYQITIYVARGRRTFSIKH